MTPKGTTPSKSTTSIHKKKTTLETEKQKFTRQRRHAEETLNDANQTRTKDLKITKSSRLL